MYHVTEFYLIGRIKLEQVHSNNYPHSYQYGNTSFHSFGIKNPLGWLLTQTNNHDIMSIHLIIYLAKQYIYPFKLLLDGL